MAQAHLELGDSWRAIQSATKAVETRPAWAPAHLTLARAQLAFGEPELALSTAEAAFKLAPESEEAAGEVAGIRVLVLKRAAAGAGAAGQRLQVRQAAVGVQQGAADGEREQDAAAG